MEYLYYKGNQKTTELQETKLLQVYENHSVEIDDKIVEFWKSENALPSTDFQFISQRLSEVLFVVLNDNDEVVGVSSGTAVYFQQIKNYFLYLRAFVGKNLRGNNRHVGSNLYFATFDLFNELKVLSDQPIVGILIIYESEHLNKVIDYYRSEYYRNQVFVGWTQNNEQIRITYFNDSKIF